MGNYTLPAARIAKATGPQKPDKPRPDFPLYAHACGRWAVKLKGGKFVYFARWGERIDGVMTRIPGDGWEKAEAEYNDHLAGKPKPDEVPPPHRVNVAYLCNRFLTFQSNRLKAGKIGQSMYDEYKAVTDLLVNEFGNKTLVIELRATDFSNLRDRMAARWKTVRLANTITRVKTVFRYGYNFELIAERIRYVEPGHPAFAKPENVELRKEEQERDAAHGKRMLEAAECRTLIDAAPVPLKAMILLGLNCGFGPSDCAKLPLASLDLVKGWVEFPRPKTRVERRIPLWPETISALQNTIAERPKAKNAEDEKLVFLTASRRSWLCRGIANPVSIAMRKHMKKVGVHRERLGGYVYRHVFRTIADGAKDQVAANAIMGHVDGSMAGKYRERIDDARLVDVSNYVRDWLFADAGKGGAE